MYTGAVTDPAAVVTVTWSLAPTPSRAAAEGCSSTQVCHAILLTGSGNSCSHGLFAPAPTPSAGDGCTTRKNSPSPEIACAFVGNAADVVVRARTEPWPSPFPAASVKALRPAGYRDMRKSRYVAHGYRDDMAL